MGVKRRRWCAICLHTHYTHTFLYLSIKSSFFYWPFSPPFLKTHCYSCFFHWFDWQVRGHVNRYRPHPLSALGLALYSCGMGTRTPRASSPTHLQRLTLCVTFPHVAAYMHATHPPFHSHVFVDVLFLQISHIPEMTVMFMSCSKLLWVCVCGENSS